MINILILFFATFIHLTFATKIGCGNDYITSNWNHNAFNYYFLPSNIETTLYCIGFDRNRLINDDEDATTFNRTGSLIHRGLRSFEHLDEETNVLYFKEIFHFIFYNQQLHINKSLDHCLDNTFDWIDIPTKYASKFLPNLALEYWSNYDFSGLAICPAGYLYVKTNVNDITKQLCQIELYSYPFDKHTCEVSFVFGKFYQINFEMTIWIIFDL